MADDLDLPQVYFESDDVQACIVTCGGLCPGINTVIREIVCGLHYMYGVNKVLGIEVIDKSFGFDTAVEEAQRAINAAHVEAESFENGVGVVKLMGRYSGFIAMYATLASRDVDCCLIPESPFYLEGPGGLFEYMEKTLKENGHMVIVIAEGAGQELLMSSMDQQDASGNKLLQDVGLWISQKIKDHFTKRKNMVINLKYIDPTYMIRAIPSIASDNVYCTLLAHSAIHGAMAGYTGFTVGPVNGRHAYIPFYVKCGPGVLSSTNQPSFLNPRDVIEAKKEEEPESKLLDGNNGRAIERQNKVVMTDRMWARVLSATNQPSVLNPRDVIEAKKEEEPESKLLDGNNDVSN
ncbi:phosphofructokinase 7 [Actinidia rufa]|uniref:Phosphofructokinase 7 n=1 Tax=Actinidia rufa TaxID=165716 RepID=A0A7J0FEK1_9ERIC|nr:phosphofructokinase 7 [Actinidia rufa]